MSKKKKEESGQELVPYDAVSGIVPNDYYGNYHERYQQEYNYISGILPIDNNLQEQIIKYNALTNLAKAVNRDTEIAKIDIREVIQDFLNTQRSKETVKNYENSIKVFQVFCEDNNIDLFKTDQKDANKYLKYLNGRYATQSVHSRIRGISSFFNYLYLQHPDIISRNPFLKLKLPVVVDTFEKDYITDKDIKVLCDYFKKIDRPDYLCAVKMMHKHGWRIGIFKSLKIDDAGRWIGISKGQSYDGTFTKSEVKELLNSGVLQLETYTASAKIKTVTTRLFKQGKISCAFSAHDIRRRRMALDLESVDADKLIAKSQKYHKNVKTTIDYVKGKYRSK